MVKARFYFEPPRNSKPKNFIMKELDNSYKEINNVERLVTRLSSAEGELRNFSLESEDAKIHSGEWSFPCFLFSIKSAEPEHFQYCVRRLLEITDSLFPFKVESSKKGYELIQNGAKSKYEISLKRFFGSGRKIIINSTKV